MIANTRVLWSRFNFQKNYCHQIALVKHFKIVIKNKKVQWGSSEDE